MPIEYCDLYDINHNPVGKTVVRGEDPGPNEYYLAVHIWIRNSAGDYLIQKRSPQKSSPNIWAVTGGAVSSGMDGRQTCQQEVLEELGIHLPAEDFHYVALWTTPHVLLEIWHISAEIDLADVTLQLEEVTAVQWVNESTLKQMIADGTFWNNGEGYFEAAQVFNN